MNFTQSISSVFLWPTKEGQAGYQNKAKWWSPISEKGLLHGLLWHEQLRAIPFEKLVVGVWRRPFGPPRGNFFVFQFSRGTLQWCFFFKLGVTPIKRGWVEKIDYPTIVGWFGCEITPWWYRTFLQTTLRWYLNHSRTTPRHFFFGAPDIPPPPFQME